MIEQYVTTWLAKHSATIEEAARRCPERGWELHEARDETAKILGLWDEWTDLLQRADQALARHKAKYPALWSRARKLRTALSGGTLTRAAHESNGNKMKSDFLKLREEYDGFEMKFEGMFRSLLASNIWYAEGSVDRDLAERQKVFPDAWERLEIRNWQSDRISEPKAKGLAGLGHLHGVRVFPLGFEDRNPTKTSKSQKVPGKTEVMEIYQDLLKHLIPGTKLSPEMSGPKVADIISEIFQRRHEGEPKPKRLTPKYILELISSAWIVNKGEL